MRARKGRLELLRTHVAAVRTFNLRRDDNWLDRLDQPAWAARKTAIRDMIDYACAQTLAYIKSLGEGDAFNTASVNDTFFNGVSPQFPVPFVNVMVGTFMLEGLRGAVDVQKELSSLNLDWPRAMVLVSSRAGSNVSSGLTEGTNWLVLFLKATSGFALPDERVKIVPYAEVRSTLGGARLSPADLAYYACSEFGVHSIIAGLFQIRCFQAYQPSTCRHGRLCRGTTQTTPAAAIDQFMIRMKHSLRDAREMLSNTVAFWMVRELAAKKWDPAIVDIPGVTTGFPSGVAGYPAVTLQ